MQDERNLKPQGEENLENAESMEQQENKERPLSDTQKIVRRHLENEDDIITDEDIASVRVGMTSAHMDSPTRARFEDKETTEETEKEILKENNEKDEEEPNRDPITPWDTVDPD